MLHKTEMAHDLCTIVNHGERGTRRISYPFIYWPGAAEGAEFGDGPSWLLGGWVLGGWSAGGWLLDAWLVGGCGRAGSAPLRSARVGLKNMVVMY